jgi:hypothetical protein
MAADERVFGVYGPGHARDVLSQLLQGSGYNVMMIGDQGQGTPREILLSPRHTGATETVSGNSQSNANDEDSDVEDQPQSPPVAAPPRFMLPPGDRGVAPGSPPRTPQQILQEMQQRQQRMQQTQQQANPQN